MGLIRAAMGAAGGVMADQWKEYFYCEAMPADLLATRGWKRQSGRSANTKGSDNIIYKRLHRGRCRRPVCYDRGAG